MDFYKVLEVTPNATREEISTAYRRLARKYHPDAQPKNSTNEQIQAAVERFKEVTSAYTVLNDEGKRALYDSKIRTKYTPPKKQAKPAKTKDREQWFARNDPNMGNIKVPPPPMFDIWGRKLTPQEQKEWIRMASSNAYSEGHIPMWGRASKRDKPWAENGFKDVFASSYEHVKNYNATPPPVRPKWREEVYAEFKDVYEKQYVEDQPKKKPYEHPYQEFFDQQNKEKEGNKDI